MCEPYFHFRGSEWEHKRLGSRKGGERKEGNVISLSLLLCEGLNKESVPQATVWSPESHLTKRAEGSRCLSVL